MILQKSEFVYKEGIVIHVHRFKSTKITFAFEFWYTHVYSLPHSGGSRNFERGGGAPESSLEIAKISRILSLKSSVLLTFDGKFRAKRRGAAPFKYATASSEHEMAKMPEWSVSKHKYELQVW
jgi:hypothetical protein